MFSLHEGLLAIDDIDALRQAALIHVLAHIDALEGIDIAVNIRALNPFYRSRGVVNHEADLRREVGDLAQHLIQLEPAAERLDVRLARGVPELVLADEQTVGGNHGLRQGAGELALLFILTSHRHVLHPFSQRHAIQFYFRDVLIGFYEYKCASFQIATGRNGIFIKFY